MSLAHCDNLKGKELKELDLILDYEYYALHGGLAAVCLLNDEKKLAMYPFGWCELESSDWQETVKKKISGRVIDGETWHIKIGVLKHLWKAVL